VYTSFNLPAIEISGGGGISFRLESFARYLRLVGFAYFSPKFHGCSVHLIVLERSCNAFPPRQCVRVTPCIAFQLTNFLFELHDSIFNTSRRHDRTPTGETFASALSENPASCEKPKIPRPVEHASVSWHGDELQSVIQDAAVDIKPACRKATTSKLGRFCGKRRNQKWTAIGFFRSHAVRRHTF
jgi:hypothetical protein